MKDREMKPRGYAVGPHATGWYSPDILIPSDRKVVISDENQQPVDSLAFQRMILRGLRRAETEANSKPSTDTAELDVVDHPPRRRISIPAAAAERAIRETIKAENRLGEMETSLSALRGIIAHAAPEQAEAATKPAARVRKK